VELSRIVAKAIWSQAEAEEVLLAQKESGQSVASFAKRHGFSTNRLFYWKKRLQQTPDASPMGQKAREPGPMDAKELESAAVERALSCELSAEATGDRQVQAYVMRAVGAEPRMWSVYEVRAIGLLLLCVVRWEGYNGPRPYSLVELDRRAPALRWREYETLREAQDALKARDGRRSDTRLTEGVPLLLPVKVNGADGPGALPSATKPTGRHKMYGVSVHLPSGVRIRIWSGSEPELVRTVLGAALSVAP
jgi:transposase-like protein